MARTTGPLLSLGGSGTIAKTQVYSTWRGIPYARQYVVPANPQTAEQTKTRGVFGFLTQAWKLAPSIVQLPWTANAKGKKYTDRNKFIGDNTKILRPGTDMTGFTGSPGANGGLVAASIAATPAAGQITVALGAPDLPTGWTITKGVAWVIKNADPHSATDYSSAAGSDLTTPYSIVLTGLDATEYLVMGWFEFLKPDGSTAYGPSISTTATPT